MAYQWQRLLSEESWSAIAGATEDSYTLTAADIGKQLRVEVTMMDAGGQVEILHSAATAEVETAPIVTGVFLRPTPDGTDGIGDIEVSVGFPERVRVTGTPTLTLMIGDEQKTAQYVSASDETTLVFRYRVMRGDAVPGGVGIVAMRLSLPEGASIRDRDGRDLVLGHVRVMADTEHKVDTSARSSSEEVRSKRGRRSTATDNNDPPQAAADEVVAKPGQPRVMDPAELTENDKDPDGDKLTVTDVGSAVNGVVSIGSLLVQKDVRGTPGQYLQSYDGQELPEGMVVQGMEIHYAVTLPVGHGLDEASTKYTFRFEKKQGNVKFLGTQGGATNHFRADWYGENVIIIQAKDKNNKVIMVKDKVFVHFASSRVLGGDAEGLTEDQRNDAFHDEIHDIGNPQRGMAFLPRDHSRGDPVSEEMERGFYFVKEPRLFMTSKGTLLVTTHIGRRNGPGEVRENTDSHIGQGIALSRSTDHGHSWDGQILTQQNRNHWGYTAMVEVEEDHNGKKVDAIYVYVSAGSWNHNTTRSWQPWNNVDYRGIYYFKSIDDGATWTEPIEHVGLNKVVLKGTKPVTSNGITYGNVPTGIGPTTNILKVPGLVLDGQTAPEGQGLLLHTYVWGYMFASIDGGTTWKKVADHDGCDGATMLNEVAWEVLDNDDQDIYMLFRHSYGDYKLEYVITKEMTSSTDKKHCGLTFRAKHHTSLGNVPANTAHHWMDVVPQGPDKGTLLFTTPGNRAAYKRYHAWLWVSREPITGEKTITRNLFQTPARVKHDIGWGQSAVEYLKSGLSNTRDMGKDAIVLVGESEPIHKDTHQIIDLKPDNVYTSSKFADERLTATTFVLSREYLELLLNPVSGAGSSVTPPAVPYTGIVFTPDASGRAGSFEYTVSDGAATATGAVTVGLNNAPGGSLALPGSTQVGDKLIADTSGITDSDGLTKAVFRYQWQRSTDGGVTWKDIIGEIFDDYTVMPADMEQQVRVLVRYRDDRGSAEAVTSTEAAVVLSPTVVNTAITSSGPYKEGAVIDVTVTYNQVVVVNETDGTPFLMLVVGAHLRQAEYASGSASTELVFRYTVQAGETDTDGVIVRVNSLTLNGGTIQNSAGNAAVLEHSKVVAAIGQEVDTTAPGVLTVTWPTDTGSSRSDGITKENTVIIAGKEAGASWEYSVNSGTDWTDGSGTSFILSDRVYAIDAIRVRQRDEADNTSAVSKNAGEITVDTSAPSVTRTAITSMGPYRLGDVIDVTVTYDQKVEVTGAPSLTLVVGSTERQAEYDSGTGSTVLVFRYTVVASETDGDGVVVKASSLTLNGGTIQDLAGNAALRTHNMVAPAIDQKVDTTVPAALTMTLSRDTGSSGSDGITKDGGVTITRLEDGASWEYSTDSGQNWMRGTDTSFTLPEGVYAINVIQVRQTNALRNTSAVTGNTAAITVDATAPGALTMALSRDTGSSGSDGITKDGRVTITGLENGASWEYSTDIGQSWMEGTDTSFTLPDGVYAINTIQVRQTDAAGNRSSVSKNATEITVDATAPTVTSTAITSTSPYKAGDVIQVEVTYDENVDVTGTPFLTLMVGTAERQALYAGGTGSNKLVFRYTVQSDETDTDGLVVKADSLALNSGDKISDKAGNAALLTHTAVYAVAPALVTDASQRRVNAAKLREGVPLTTGPVRVTDDVVLQAPVPVGAAVGSDFTLTSSERGITTVVIDGSTYALVPAYGDDVVQIIDISDPTTPRAVAALEDDADGFTELESPIDITTVVIDGSTYALVAAYDDDGVQIIDISDPSDPQAVAALEDGKGGFTALYGAYGVTTAVIGGKTYALVAARGNYDGDYDGVQIIDISDPSDPKAVAALEDDADGFTMLGRAFAITTAVIGGKTYALVAANDDSGVQIIDISNPSGPKAVVALEDDTGGFTMLASPTDITTVVIDGRTYALVASSADNGVQIIDISNPSSPKAVAALEDGVGGFDSLELAWGITTVVIGDRTYALVAAYSDDGVQIIDISDPSGPKAVAALEDGVGGFDSLGGVDGITTVTVEGRVYALVAAYDDDAVQIIELPIQPSIASIKINTEGLGATHEQLRYGAGETDSLAIGGGANTEKTGITIAGIDGLELAWSASDNSITIRKADNNALTTVEAETIIAALRYTHGDADNAGEGERVFTFVLRDTAGNETASARQVSVSVEVDRTAPGVLRVTWPTDTGSSGSDGITNANRVTISTPETGASWEYSTDSGKSWMGGTDTSFTLPDGTYIKDAIWVRQRDAADNPSAVSKNPTGITVDATAPTVTSTAITSTSPYKAGDAIEVEVTYDENVEVTGTPFLTLMVGTTEREALYAGGTGSNKLVFRYTVQSGETDTDRLVVKASSLALNSGDKISDKAGNAALLTHTAVYAVAPVLVTDASRREVNAAKLGEGVSLTTGPVRVTDDVVLQAPKAAAAAVDGSDFRLRSSEIGITTVVIGDSTYALVPAYDDDAVQIIDISDPSDPKAVVALEDDKGGFDRLGGAIDITTVVIDGKTYALVAAGNDDGVQIIDISTPSSPRAVVALEDGKGGFTALYSANGVTTAVIGGKTYALVAARGDYNGDYDGVHIIDISDPSGPRAVAALEDDAGDFTMLGGAFAITTTVIGGKTYALVVANDDDGVQIIDISTPSSPRAVVALEDDAGGFTMLGGATDITTVVIDGRTYALVVASTDNGVQIIDISDPSGPRAVAALEDGKGGFDMLDRAWGITTVVIGDSTYALVAAYGDGGVQIIDISDPSGPRAVAALEDGKGGFDSLGGAAGVTTVKVEGRVYALVAAYDDNAVQIIELPIQPSIASIEIKTRGLGAAHEQLRYGAGLDDFLAIGGQTDSEKTGVVIAGIDGLELAWSVGDNSITIRKADNSALLTIQTEAIIAALRYAHGDAANAGEGERVFTFVLRDTAGNETASARQVGVSVVVDKTPPAAPTLELNEDTGDSTSDGVTSNGAFTVGGVESGASWEYSTDSGNSWTNGSGNSFTLSDRVYAIDAIHVRQRDAADNPSAVSKNPTEITVDTRAPSALTMSLPTDTGKSSSDGLTKENRVTISGKESGASWEYSTDSGQNWTPGSVTSFTLSDGTYTKDMIHVRQTDAAGNTSTVSKNPTGRTVDTLAPSVTNTEITSAGPYKAGAVIEVKVTYDEDVDVTGTPYLTLEVGSTNRQAEYQSGTGSTELVFRYTVGARETDANGVVVKASSLDLNSGTIQDGAGNAASLTNQAVGVADDQKVDTTAPRVTRTAITSSGPYKAGAAIDVTVTYNEAVEVDTKSGTPYLTLVVGTTNQRAAYHSGKGSTDLVFRYTVQSGETDTNGVVVTANSLTLNGGKISDVAGNAASRTNLAVIAANAQKVDTTAPASLTVSWPTDTGSSNKDGITNANTVTISTPESGASWEYSTDSGNKWKTGSSTSFTLLDGVYTINAIQVRQRDAADNPSVVIGNTKQITVDTRAPSALTMTLPTDVGKSSSDGITKEDSVTVGGVESGATWEYSTDSGQSWTTGTATSFTLPDGDYVKDAIRVRQTDAAGNTSTVRTNTPVITVDTTAPSVTNTEITSRGPYKAGDVIEVTVTYDEAVEVVTTNGRPSLTLKVGSNDRQALYVRGKGSTELVFQYTVGSSDTDANGVVVTASSLTLNRGTLQDVAGNAASRTNLAVIAANAQKVDTTAPAPLTVSWPRDTGRSSSDGITNVNTVTISTPESGASWEYSTDSGNSWTTGSSTSFILPDRVYAIDAIRVRQRDAADNPSAVSKNAKGITVDTRAPSALTMTLPTDVGKSSSDGITKEDSVTVGGVESGATWEYSTDSGQSWTTGTATSFTLPDGDYVKDAIRVRQTDAAGNTSTVRTNTPVITVDTTAPSVTNTEITSRGPYKAGDVIEVTVTYDEAVEVVTTNGRPSLTLKVGSNDRQALYVRGKGSTELVFQYTVGSSDTDANGVVVTASSLTLNRGTLQDVAGNAASRTNLAVIAANAQKVDTTAPAPLTVSWPRDTGRSSSDGITNVNTVTISTPESGASWEYSTDSGNSWTTGSSTSFILPDRVYAIDAIRVRQRDAADNPSAVSKNAKGITVDTRAPSALTMTLPTDVGKSSSDGITKEDSVTVGGVESGATWEYSTDSGQSWTTGTATSFTLPDGDYVKDAIRVRQTDAAGNTSTVRTNTPVITVDTTAPSVTNTEITSRGPYKAGDVIEVTVTYDEAVEVVTTNGRPSLTLKVGSNDRQALYVRGKGSTELVFQYTVGSSDTDANGVVVTASSLTLNRGTLQDVAGNAASRTNLAVIAANAQKVDTTAPAPLTVSWPRDTGRSSSDGITNVNTVTISTPESGASWEYSTDSGNSWTTGSSTSFILPDRVYAIDAIRVRQRDAADNPSAVSKNAKGITVDTRAPSALTMTLPTDVGKSSSDGITKEDSVTVGGVESGATWEYSTDSGQSWTTGTATSFTLPDGDYVKDAIRVRQTDAAGNTSTVRTNTPVITVDTTAPSVTNTEITSRGPYKAGDVIEVTVTYDEAVEVVTTNGRPSLTLKVGSNDRQALYVRGKGSTELVFQYTVGSSDTDANGVVVTASSLTLNRGTLQDVAGNAASRTNLAVIAANAQKVDTTAPAPLTVSWPRDTGRSSSDGITNVNTVTISTPESGASWEYSTDSGNSWTTGSSTSFILPDRVYAIDAIRVRQRDAADNPSAVSKNAKGITVDTRAPSALTMTLPTDVGKSSSDGITKEDSVTVGGVESGATWEYSTDSGQSWTTGTATSFMPDGDYVKDAIRVRQTDAAGNTSTVRTNTPVITVDTTAPSVTNTEITSRGPYKAGDVIEVTVTYDEAVEVVTTNGRPSLTLKVGSNDRQALYVRGKGSTELSTRWGRAIRMRTVWL